MTRSKGLTRKKPWVRKPAPLKQKAPWAKRNAAPMQRRRRIKPRSDRKQADHDAYMAEKRRRMEAQVVERGHTFCQKCDQPREVDGHHPGGQATRARIMVFFLLCRECHQWAHDNSNAARKEGWIEPI